MDPLSSEALRQDALRELVNIAFGHAARPLSELLERFIELAVPHVELSSTAEIPSKLSVLLGPEDHVHVVRQAFRPHFRGESLLVLRAASTEGLVDVFGLASSDEELKEHQAAVLETANILAGACVGKLSELLSTATVFSPPAFLIYDSPVEDLASHVPEELTEAVLIRTDLGTAGEEGRNLLGYLFILFPKEGRRWLDEALDQYVAELG